jgi:CheY-like chemotaxis protein
MKKKYSKILLLDDQIELTKFLSKVLKDNGCKTRSFELKTKAYDWLVKHHADIIITDINSPYMNGYQFLGWLRANPSTKHIPIIFLTATACLETSLKIFRQEGKHELLSKPCDLSEFLQVVRWTEEKPRPKRRIMRKLSKQVLTERNEIQFIEWSELTKIFHRFLTGLKTRTAIITETEEWSIYFTVEKDSRLIGGIFYRPMNTGEILFEDIFRFKIFLQDHGMRTGIMMGFFTAAEKIRDVASLLEIELIDCIQTNQLFGISIVDDNEQRSDNVKKFYLDINLNKDTRVFGLFGEKVFKQIYRLRGKTFTITYSYSADTSDEIKLIVKIGTPQGRCCSLKIMNEPNQIDMYVTNLWYALGLLWVYGRLDKYEIDSDRKSSACIFGVLAMLPSINCVDDKLIMRPHHKLNRK